MSISFTRPLSLDSAVPPAAGAEAAATGYFHYFAVVLLVEF